MNALKSLRFITLGFFKAFDVGEGLKKGVSDNKDLIR